MIAVSGSLAGTLYATVEEFRKDEDGLQAGVDIGFVIGLFLDLIWLIYTFCNLEFCLEMAEMLNQENDETSSQPEQLENGNER